MILLLVAVLGTAAPASAAASARALVCPHDGGPRWHATRTAHVRLAANVAPERVPSLAAEIEEIYGDLVSIAPLALLQEPPVAAGSVDVVAFTDADAVERLGQVGVLGYWLRDRVTIVDGHNDQLVRHELVHHVVARMLGDVPRWLNEGLAEYLSTARVDEGRARVGDIPDRIHGLGGHGRTTFAGEHIPSLAELLAAPDAEFDGHYGLYYAAAWILVHLVNNEHPEHRARFRAYLRALARGVGPEEAWKRAFAPVAPVLERQYGELLANLCQRGEFVTATNLLTNVAAPPPTAPPSPPVELADGDVHALWLARQSGAIAERLAQAHAARPHDPDSFELAFATYELQREAEPQAAAATLAALAGARPDDERILRARIEAGLKARRDVTADAARLTRNAHEPASLGLIGLCSMTHGDRRRAVDFARRGIERDQGCGTCWIALTIVYLASGQPADARTAFNHVIALFDRRQPLPPEIASLRSRLAHVAAAR